MTDRPSVEAGEILVSFAVIQVDNLWCSVGNRSGVSARPHDRDPRTGRRRMSEPRYTEHLTKRDEKMTAKKGTRKSAKSTGGIGKTSEGFTDDERVAMRERLQELKAEGRRGPARTRRTGKAPCSRSSPRWRNRIAPWASGSMRSSRPAPALSPRLWYGMPAYAKDGKVVCFFQSAAKFKTRYATFGFQHAANLDEGAMWPVAFALKDLTAAEEARIALLVKRAVSED